MQARPYLLTYRLTLSYCSLACLGRLLYVVWDRRGRDVTRQALTSLFTDHRTS